MAWSHRDYDRAVQWLVHNYLLCLSDELPGRQLGKLCAKQGATPSRDPLTMQGTAPLSKSILNEMMSGKGSFTAVQLQVLYLILLFDKLLSLIECLSNN